MSAHNFKLCLTMAGAVSAGAYTAGVIDELLTVLDLWEKAKMRNRELGPDHPEYDHSLPMHTVELEVLSGASAGGITAALALKKIMDGGYDSMESNTILRDCWVNMADEPGRNTLEKLLDTSDLKGTASPGSLLRAKPIEELADTFLKPLSELNRPPWLSSAAEVVLTTTNLEGIDINIHFDGSDKHTSGHRITQHSSVFRFTPAATTGKSSPVLNPYHYTADLRSENDMVLLKKAALSTSAFPLGLPTRKVTLPHRPYLKYLREEEQQKGLHMDPVAADRPAEFPSIDGGLLNNEPYGWALKILRENNREAVNHNRYAVVMIDPFPSTPPVRSKEKDFGLVQTLTAMFNALRNEVMLNQEGLSEAISLRDRTKFLIAPRKGGTYPPELNVQGKVLASSPISGFAGFINKEYRTHDYELGRRNCRDFIRFHFTLPVEEARKRLATSLNNDMEERFGILPRNHKAPVLPHFPILPDVRLKEARTQTLQSSFTEGYEYPDLPGFSLSDFRIGYGALLDKRISRLVKALTRKWWLALAFRIFLLPTVRKKIYATLQREMEFLTHEKNTGNSSQNPV